jgi:hypothetical protein
LTLAGWINKKTRMQVRLKASHGSDPERKRD